MKIPFSALEGHTILEVHVKGTEKITFDDETNRFTMFHEEDCCEEVYIEDIVGDIQSLVDQTVISATEDSNHDNPKGHDESSTWTFYTIRTMLDTITIRWYGTSNGYYSESVDFHVEPR